MGSGKQYYPWIHIDDRSRIFIYAIKNNLQGIYIGTSPYPRANIDITRMIAEVLHRPLMFISSPSFILKVAMGERAQVLLDSQKTNANKIKVAGFEFKFAELENALKDIFEKGV